MNAIGGNDKLHPAYDSVFDAPRKYFALHDEWCGYRFRLDYLHSTTTPDTFDLSTEQNKFCLAALHTLNFITHSPLVLLVDCDSFFIVYNQ